MKIKLRWYGTLKAAVGSRETETELPEGTRLEQLPSLLKSKYGGTVFHLLGGEELFSRVMVLVNGRYHTGLEGLETLLTDGDTVALMPPMAGG